MKTTGGVHLEVLWHDTDVVEVRVSASNGVFSGVADVYLGLDALTAVADGVDGFPTGASDRREVTLGAFGADSAGGGATLRFDCTDGLGHARVEVIIEGDHRMSRGRPQTVDLFIPVESAAVDRFVSAVRSIATALEGVASLEPAA